MVDRDWHSVSAFVEYIENNYPVDRWKIDGVPAWPLIRLRIGAASNAIFRHDMCRLDCIEVKHSNRWTDYVNVLEEPFKSQFQLSFLDSIHNEKRKSADIVMLGSSVSRNICLPTGEWLDHSLDPLRNELEQLGYSVFAFETVENEVKYPRYSNSCAVDLMCLKALIMGKMYNLARKQIKMEIDSVQNVLNECIKFGLRPHDLNFEYYFKVVRNIHILSLYFKDELMKIKPKLVIFANWASETKMAMAVAAHMLHIPIIEIQHGAIFKGKISYSNWNLPPLGYEVMPDYIWTWNQESYDVIASWGRDKVIPFVGGEPEKLIWGSRNGKFFSLYQNAFERNFCILKPAILITLQYNTIYPDWFAEFINKTESCAWLVRFHPHRDKMQEDFVSKLAQKENIIWQGVDQFPLDVLLQNVFLHITSCSSVVINGELYGIPSIVLASFAQQMFSPQIKRGIARFIDNDNDLLVAIHEFLSKREAMHEIKKRTKQLYARGQSGIQCMIKIIEK